MREVLACPNCDSVDTEHAHTAVYPDEGMVHTVRVCNDCPTEYNVEYGSPLVTDVFTEE